MAAGRVVSAGRGPRARLCVLAGVVALALGGALGVAAQAAGGDISYDGCLSNDGTGGHCTVAPGNPLSDATAVAVSPDGRSVYVASINSDSLTHFFAAPGGQLTFDTCFNDDGSGGCKAIAGSPLDGAVSVAVSPDGRSVYVTGIKAGAVSHFFADATGQLSYDGCLSDTGSGGHCANAGPALTSAIGVAVSPNGNSVYVAGNGAISHMFVAPQGQLTYDGCISDDGSGGRCADAPGTPLTGAFGVAVSPDSRSVYVTAVSSSTVTHFFAAPQGQLSYDGCVSNGGSGGNCANAPGSALQSPRGIVVSPDGKSVYVSGTDQGAVSHFSAAPGGQITFQNCVSQDGTGGHCTDVPGTITAGTDALAISPEGDRLYVTSFPQNAISTFTVSGSGDLTYASCVSSTGTGGLCGSQPGAALSGPNGIAVNPAGTALYVAASNSSALLHFFRATSGSSGGGSGGGGGGGGGGGTVGGAGGSAATISGLALKPPVFGAAPGGPTVITPATKNRKGTLISYQLSGASTVTFTVERARPGRLSNVAGNRHCVVQTHRNARARPCTRLVSVGTFTQDAVAGANTIRFSGRIGGKKLPRGGYTLVATPDGGTAATVKFKIKG